MRAGGFSTVSPRSKTGKQNWARRGGKKGRRNARGRIRRASIVIFQPRDHHSLFSFSFVSTFFLPPSPTIRRLRVWSCSIPNDRMTPSTQRKPTTLHKNDSILVKSRQYYATPHPRTSPLAQARHPPVIVPIVIRLTTTAPPVKPPGPPLRDPHQLQAPPPLPSIPCFLPFLCFISLPSRSAFPLDDAFTLRS